MYNTLKKYFGYTEFRPLQKEVIESVLNKKDAFVLMPTGGGKSLCYQLPTIMQDGLCIVVSPLISLMKDQVDGLVQNGVNAAYLNSALDFETQQIIIDSLKNNEIDLLYVAPERLLQDHFLNLLSTLNINLFAIDEAHCVSEWGHDFRPEYRKLKILKEKFNKIPILALTATATKRVRSDIIAELDLNDAATFHSSFDRPNLNYEVRNKKNAYGQLIAYLDDHKNQSGIIYCHSRKSVMKLADALVTEGLSALPYHAGLSSKKRAINQEKFIKDDVNIIVATVAFGMGIDKPDVRFVVHYDLPSNLERYYQETGRAGRDGLPSDCILFFSYGDKAKITFFIEQKESTQEKDIAYGQLRNILDFAESNVCRRKVLLNYFNEEYKKDNCQKCDNCLTPHEKIDGTIIAQKILSCVYRVGERFGAAHISKILTGSSAKQILQNNHDKLNVYNSVQDYSAHSVSRFIRELVQLEILQLTEGKYPILKLTQKSHDFLKSKSTILLNNPIDETTSFKQVVDFDQDLFKKLKNLRKEIATEKNIPPYQVFHDVALQEMCLRYPHTKQSFVTIAGVGDKKVETYGQTFINEIISYCHKHKITEVDLPKQHVKNNEKKKQLKTSKTPTAMLTFKLYQENKSVEEIAKIRKFKPSTIISHLEQAMLFGKKIDINPFVTQKKQKLIMQVFDKLGTDKIGPVKHQLGDNFSYDEIKLTRGKYLTD